MLNRVILIGRLTRDPDMRYSPSGVACTTFTLAVDRTLKNENGERERRINHASISRTNQR